MTGTGRHTRQTGAHGALRNARSQCKVTASHGTDLRDAGGTGVLPATAKLPRPAAVCPASILSPALPYGQRKRGGWGGKRARGGQEGGRARGREGGASGWGGVRGRGEGKGSAWRPASRRGWTTSWVKDAGFSYQLPETHCTGLLGRVLGTPLADYSSPDPPITGDHVPAEIGRAHV